VDNEGKLSVLTISPQIEDFIRESIQKTEQGSFLNLEPNLAQHIIEQTQEMVDKVINDGYQPIILTTPVTRRHLRYLLERFMPQVTVLSNNEITGQTKIRSLGTIELNK